MATIIPEAPAPLRVLGLKIVHGFHPATGQYTGPTEAYESPEDEPGHYLMPAHTTELPPPEAPAGKAAYFEAGAWRLGDAPQEPGEPEPIPPPPPTQEEIERARLARAVELMDLRLNGVARSYGYDNIVTAVTYADEPAVPKFQAEGRMFRKWRSLVYAAGYEVLAEIQGGAPWPTEEEFLARLPDVSAGLPAEPPAEPPAPAP